MTIDKSRPIALLDENSTQIESEIFNIFPGEIGIIQAFGFQEYKNRADTTEVKTIQAACLQMILFKDTMMPTFENCNTPIIDLNKYKGQVLAKEYVSINNCTQSISLCNNTFLIDLPGSYRFILNDPTAIGTVRIYLRIMTHEEFPRYSKFFIGE